MDALPPPPPHGGGGNGGDDNGKQRQGAPGSGGASGLAGAAQQVVDLFGPSDLPAASLVLILVVLGLMSQAMTRCVCT